MKIDTDTDLGILVWLHERLVKVHGEDELFGYMHRLRAIIANTPPDRRSRGCSNSMAELARDLNLEIP